MDPLQKMYNDWCDRGGDAANFYAQNKILDDECENLREKLERNYQALQEKRQQDPQERVKIIQKRLQNYEKHKNDPCVYSQREINEVRTLLQHAPADIEFLLYELHKIKMLATKYMAKEAARIFK